MASSWITIENHQVSLYPHLSNPQIPAHTHCTIFGVWTRCHSFFLMVIHESEFYLSYWLECLCLGLGIAEQLTELPFFHCLLSVTTEHFITYCCSECCSLFKAWGHSLQYFLFFVLFSVPSCNQHLKHLISTRPNEVSCRHFDFIKHSTGHR